MDASSQALLTGFLRVAAGSIVGYLCYRGLRPSIGATGPVASGRRFLAWSLFVSNITFFGPNFIPPSVAGFVEWLVLNVVFGLFAFLAGLAWGAARKQHPGSTSLDQTAMSAPDQNRTTARQILEIRLAKGEISISEFQQLIAVLNIAPSAGGLKPSEKDPVIPEVTMDTDPSKSIRQAERLKEAEALRQNELARLRHEETIRAGLEFDRASRLAARTKDGSGNRESEAAAPPLDEMLDAMKKARAASKWNPL